MAFNFNDALVTVRTGDTYIKVYEHVIRAASPFFDVVVAALRHEENKVVKLPVFFHADTFQIYARWLYSGRLYILPSEGDELYAVQEQLRRICQGYMLGDYIQDGVYCDILTDELVRLAKTAPNKYLVHILALVVPVWDTTTYDSPLQVLIWHIFFGKLVHNHSIPRDVFHMEDPKSSWGWPGYDIPFNRDLHERSWGWTGYDIPGDLLHLHFCSDLLRNESEYLRHFITPLSRLAIWSYPCRYHCHGGKPCYKATRVTSKSGIQVVHFKAWDLHGATSASSESSPTSEQTESQPTA